MKISKKIGLALVKGAMEQLARFKLPMGDYRLENLLVDEERLTATVIFKHVMSSAEIVVPINRFDPQTGEIVECGQNRGKLTL